MVSKLGLGLGVFFRTWLGVAGMGGVCGGLFGFVVVLIAALFSTNSNLPTLLNVLIIGFVAGVIYGIWAGIVIGFIDALVFSFLCLDFVRKAEFDHSLLRKKATLCGVGVAGICGLLLIVIIIVSSHSIAVLLILGVPVLIAMVATAKVNKWIANWFLKKGWSHPVGSILTWHT
jgi:hypothetical protein